MSDDLSLDPILLRSFALVAETGSFTAAADRLGLRQSTVSQHVKRLETVAGRRLLDRDTRSTRLTRDGDAMLGFARRILEVEARAARHFAEGALHGKVRFGVGEDFAATYLAAGLRDFIQANPLVDLELTVGLSGVLAQRLELGQLDLVLGKRRPGEAEGRLVGSEILVWAACDRSAVDPGRPLPLILYPAPSITRAIALETLERAGRSWRIVCESGGLIGLHAAAEAGLGVAVQARRTLPPMLRDISETPSLPPLGAVELVVMMGRGARNPPARALADLLVERGLGQ